MIGYSFIYCVLVSCGTHFIRIVLINHLRGLLVRRLLYHIVYAFIVCIIWWKVLRFLIIRPDRIVHLFLKFIMIRCVHLLLYWRKPTWYIGSRACIWLFLGSNALPMMWFPGDIGLGTLVPMNVADLSLFKSVRVLVIFHQCRVQSELLSKSVLTVSAFMRANLQFRCLLSQGSGACLIVLILVHALLGWRYASTKLNMRTAFGRCLFGHHTRKQLSFSCPTTCVSSRISPHGYLCIALQCVIIVDKHGIFNIRVVGCDSELGYKLLLSPDMIILL